MTAERAATSRFRRFSLAEGMPESEILAGYPTLTTEGMGAAAPWSSSP